ncbi:MAG: hypothetical protein ABL892_11620, partial [Thiobacillaceae bacterium]
ILQNQPLGIKGLKVQNNSWRRSRRILRVAASSNPTLKRDCAKARSPLAPFVDAVEKPLFSRNIGTKNGVDLSTPFSISAW